MTYTVVPGTPMAQHAGRQARELLVDALLDDGNIGARGFTRIIDEVAGDPDAIAYLVAALTGHAYLLAELWRAWAVQHCNGDPPSHLEAFERVVHFYTDRNG